MATELIERVRHNRSNRKWKAEHGPSLGACYMSAAQCKLEAAREQQSEKTLL